MLQNQLRARRIAAAALPLAVSLSAALCCVARSATAASVIRRPGLHPSYSAELEPHLTFVWDEPLWAEDSWGPGLRVGVPIVEDGPIGAINNSMAISLGLDWTMASIGWAFCYGERSYLAGRDCEGYAVWFPVALQWNFWLTDVISVFGEPGFAVRHAWWDDDDCIGGACRGSDTDFEPLALWGGGRFVFGGNVGVIVRIGYPSVSAGATFLL
jgi:hypothetical protein